MREPTVLLFDIDGTLVSADGAGKRALFRAFAEAGHDPAYLSFPFSGMTDRAIVRRGLQADAGSSYHVEEPDIDQVIRGYLAFLAEEVPRASNYQVLPGVETLLEELAGLDGVAVGLGTGNVEPGARIKLDRGALNHHFDFGGFGSDAEDRAHLLERGALRGAASLSSERSQCRVVVVGDTPLDVAAGHAIGAEVLAVATGSHSRADLESAGALYVQDDLGAHETRARLLG